MVTIELTSFEDVRQARERVGQLARAAGLPDPDAAVMAAGELGNNCIEHGSEGPGLLRVHCEPGRLSLQFENPCGRRPQLKTPAGGVPSGAPRSRSSSPGSAAADTGCRWRAPWRGGSTAAGRRAAPSSAPSSPDFREAYPVRLCRTGGGGAALWPRSGQRSHAGRSARCASSRRGNPGPGPGRMIDQTAEALLLTEERETGDGKSVLGLAAAVLPPRLRARDRIGPARGTAPRSEGGEVTRLFPSSCLGMGT
jgi:hypothetical protein